jgi:hypothetical protein
MKRGAWNQFRLITTVSEGNQLCGEVSAKMSRPIRNSKSQCELYHFTPALPSPALSDFHHNPSLNPANHTPIRVRMFCQRMPLQSMVFTIAEGWIASPSCDRAVGAKTDTDTNLFPQGWGIYRIDACSWSSGV